MPRRASLDGERERIGDLVDRSPGVVGYIDLPNRIFAERADVEMGVEELLRCPASVPFLSGRGDRPRAVVGIEEHAVEPRIERAAVTVAAGHRTGTAIMAILQDR